MRLVGMAACVPKNSVETTAAYEHFENFDVDRIVGNTGVKEKREAEEGTTLSDLSIAAAEPLLEELGWERDSVDALILVTTMADHIMPASSHKVHKALGLSTNCLVFDVNLGCSGFTHGMITLNALMKAGLIKRALLLCGEMTSDRFRPRLKNARHRNDLATAILFGDAGTATALEADAEGQVRAAKFGADGSGYHHILVPGGLGATPWNEELLQRRKDAEDEERRPLDLILHGPEVLTFTMKRVPPLMKDLLAQAEWTMDDVDMVVPHQANKFMLDFLARRMKIPKEKVLLAIERFGNTSSASIPLTMVAEGQELLAKKTKWAFLGFGVGLSWSGLLMETDPVKVLPLIEYEAKAE